MGSEESSVLSPAEFGRLLQRFMQASLALAPSDEPEVARRLREHLGAERLVDLPILSRDFAVHDHPNLQVAIDRLLEGGAWSAEIVGLRSQEVVYGQESLGRIALLGGGEEAEAQGLAIGALERVTVAVGAGESISCLVNALLLLRAGDLALAALIGRTDEPMGNRVRLEVIAADRAPAERFLAEVQALMREHNVYRGRIVTFGAQPWGHGDAPLTVR